ncbi:MAG: hypothetical protein PHP98_10325 [Kiritimatiellae bacterium]|nr:hypothetical protein [Kiritimatiellia bacterium]
MKMTPGIIDAVHNEKNRPVDEGLTICKKIPGLGFCLNYDKTSETLVLTVANKSKKTMEDLRITFRMPLFCKNGVKNVKLNDLTPGKEGKYCPGGLFIFQLI